MITTAGDSIDPVRFLVGDLSGDYTTDDVVLKALNLAQRMLVNDMLNLPILNRVTAVVVLPSIGGANVKDLAAYFAQGQPLQLLMK